MCFMCLMFSLSEACELLFLLCFIVSCTCVMVSLMLCPYIFYVNGSVNGSVCLVYCMFDSVGDQTIRNIVVFGC